MTKKTTEVATVSPELQKNLDIILSVKTEIDALGQNALQIKVVDETTLSVAQQNLSSINQIVKNIEDKRKKIKDPYLKAGKLIDATCNQLVELAEKGIEHIKAEIKSWEIKRQEEANRAQLELEKRLDEERMARIQDDNRRAEIREYIEKKAVPNLQHLYNTAQSALDCEKNISYIEQNFPPAGKFEEFAEEAFAHRDNYIQLLRNKRDNFLASENMSDAEKEIAKEKEKLANEKIALAQREADLRAREEEAKRETERKRLEEEAEKERFRLQQEAELNKTRNVRTVWKFELVDKTKLSQDWITMDEEKVKEYLKESKDNLKDGEVINGVKFYKDQSVRA